MQRLVTVAVTQMACDWDRAGNIARAEQMVRQAAAKGAQIVLLQELFETPYFCIEQDLKHLALASAMDENTAIQHFSALAKELDVVIPVLRFGIPGMALWAWGFVGINGFLSPHVAWQY